MAHASWAFLTPAMVLCGVLLAVAIPGCLVLVVLSLLGRGGSKTGMRAEDLKVVQEVHRALAAVERRVESLETILLERGGKE